MRIRLRRFCWRAIAGATSIAACAGLTFAQAGPAAMAEDAAPSLPVVRPEPARLHVGWDATVASRYAFQGMDYSGGSAVAQPELIVSRGCWSSTIWFNQELERGEVTEFDLLAGYSRAFHGMDAAAGYARLTYPNSDARSSQELTFLLARPGIVATALDVHWDFDAGRGVYSTFELSGDLPTPWKPVGLAVALHHQRSYYDAHGVPCVGVTLGIEQQCAGVTLSPSVVRFVSWENATFRGDARVPQGWLVSLGVAQEF